MFPLHSILKHVGDLGNILADKNGRASFRLEDKTVKVTAISILNRFQLIGDHLKCQFLFLSSVTDL